jgi:hypothetical protein
MLLHLAVFFLAAQLFFVPPICACGVSENDAEMIRGRLYLPWILSLTATVEADRTAYRATDVQDLAGFGRGFSPVEFGPDNKVEPSSNIRPRIACGRSRPQW